LKERIERQHNVYITSMNLALSRGDFLLNNKYIKEVIFLLLIYKSKQKSKQ